MASAAPPNRIVTSVFITLASPYRATITQQQPPPAAHSTHSAPCRDRQHAAVRLSPTESVPVLRHRKDDIPLLAPSEPQRTPSPTAGPLGPGPAQTGTGRGQRPVDGAAALSSPQRSSLPEDLAVPSPLAQMAVPRPLTSVQPSNSGEVKTGSEAFPEIHKNSPDTSKEVCGFCRKRVILSEPAIEAMNRTYHGGCFRCRSCHLPLAGQQYYNKAGTPLCDACYQASLELCWLCGDVITEQVIRALERAYHPHCFTCTTCRRQIGEQAFAQGEVGDVYCLQDYYRKYAPMCSCCQQLIIPAEDGTDSYTVECLGHSYHENCYRCEVCVIQLSPEPNEQGCHPLDGRLLCRTCHQDLISSQL